MPSKSILVQSITAAFALVFLATPSVPMATTTKSVKKAPKAAINAKPPAGETTGTEEKITSSALVSGRIDGVKFRPNISYLPPGRDEKLDVYLPTSRNSAKPLPVIVMIHGGGWVGGKKDAARELQAGVAFVRAGYVAVSVEYYKDRGNAWPTNIQDCKNAVRWVRAHAEELQIDPDRIGVMGGSAGGHLALMVAYTGDHPEFQAGSLYPGVSDKVSACLDLYGISNLLTRQGADKTGKPNGDLRTSHALFPESREHAPEKWKLASPITHVSAASPPTLIIHGVADTTVDRDQSSELAASLKKAGVEHELMIVPGIGHAFTLGDRRLPNDLRPVVIKFFDKHLKGQE